MSSVPVSEAFLLILFQEYKRSRHEIKKKSSDTMKLQKKARKGNRDQALITFNRANKGQAKGQARSASISV